MEEVDKEISEMKLSLNARARTVAESYLIAVWHESFCLGNLLTEILSLIHNVGGFLNCTSINILHTSAISQANFDRWKHEILVN
jgi:ARP2/3 complex 20 kDa subunit (ARPC4)